jgi:hypothetical protein
MVKITAQRDLGMVVSRSIGRVSRVFVNNAKLLNEPIVDVSTLSSREAILKLE